ncbi:hypothetical protein SAMCCGM7_pC2089 (plasmid) [Sinorhizobium americanum CCGM7]|uniref:hypothetical protein n=1 Tax=Sinorhizobium americanum TaxID=194963 RepID=UPI0004D9C0FD|nr:hypothetical protein [Sinorhizobium americanum]APG89265.1 hypothetical protein SAMCCGM7_pC2089 [Sinorhizobium americanum CCGM7]
MKKLLLLQKEVCFDRDSGSWFLQLEFPITTDTVEKARFLQRLFFWRVIETDAEN